MNTKQKHNKVYRKKSMWVIEKMGKFDEPPAIRGERERERVHQ